MFILKSRSDNNSFKKLMFLLLSYFLLNKALCRNYIQVNTCNANLNNNVKWYQQLKKSYMVGMILFLKKTGYINKLL